MRRNTKIFLFIVSIVLLVSLLLGYREIMYYFHKPTKSLLHAGAIKNNLTTTQVVAANLKIPWEIVFLPDGDLLVTERPGILKRIGKNPQQHLIADVVHVGEGGLLGIALHPQFSQNHWLYLYHTARRNNVLINRVIRYRYQDGTLSEKTVIVDNIPGGRYHDGGKIAFGPDRYLYITTGDAGVSKRAQDKNSLAGKILRLKDDGSIPNDNPFGNAIYSYGHRNSQGLAWDNNNRLWATEHGRSGILSGYDELNFIQKGGNYGWPLIQGGEHKTGMISPILHSGPIETWAPAGIAFGNGKLFFGGLRGEALYVANISDLKNISLSIYLKGKFGRIRAVVMGPEGYLYITTSNTDGRGNPQTSDDKIIKINLRAFPSEN